MAEPSRRASLSAPLRLGCLLALVTAAAYGVDAGRAFGYDAAVTMHNFVDGPPSWAFTRQVVWNNHPLFSFVTGLVADLMGSTHEVVMRVPAIAFSAGAVGVLSWRVATHFSVRAGAASGLVLAAHPLFFELGREVRGYSLALLAVVVLAVAVADVESPALGGLAAFVAMGTHAHTVIPVAALVAFLLAHKRLTRPWRISLLAAALGTALVYAGSISSSGRGTNDRMFRPLYLRDAMWEVLGGSAAPALLLAAVALLGVCTRRRVSRGVGALLGTAVVGLVAIWIVAPYDLYPRFVYWAIPALALAVGWGVHAFPWSLALVVAAALAHIWTLAPHVGQDEMPNRALAEAAGSESCMIGGIPEYMTWYADDIAIGDHCDVVAVPPRFYPEHLQQRARTGWTTLCWEDEGAEVRARAGARCP